MSKPKVIVWQTVKGVILGIGMFEACAANHSTHLSFWLARDETHVFDVHFFKEPVPKVQLVIKQRNWVQFHSSDSIAAIFTSIYDVHKKTPNV